MLEKGKIYLVLYIRLGCDRSDGRPKYIHFVDVVFFVCLFVCLFLFVCFLLTYSVVSLVSSCLLPCYLGLLVFDLCGVKRTARNG